MKYLRGFLVVLIGWYLLAFLLQGPIIPYPHAVFLHLVSSMQTSKPYLHLLFSLYRIVMGMAFALLLAIPVGMLAGRTQKLDQLISPVLYLLYPPAQDCVPSGFHGAFRYRGPLQDHAHRCHCILSCCSYDP